MFIFRCGRKKGVNSDGDGVKFCLNINGHNRVILNNVDDLLTFSSTLKGSGFHLQVHQNKCKNLHLPIEIVGII